MTFRWPRIELCCKKKIVNLFVFTFPAAVGENSLTEHLCVISITVRGQTLLMDGSSAGEKCGKSNKNWSQNTPMRNTVKTDETEQCLAFSARDAHKEKTS